MATADWNPFGDAYYRKVELYAMHPMDWSGVIDLSKHTVAASAYGGPIALLKDENKSGRATTIKPVVNVYTAAGKLQAQLRWNSGTVITMGWSNTEELLFIQDDGVVLVYDMFLVFKRTFSMGQEAKDVKILSAKVFSSFQGTGIAVMTTSFRIFLVSNIDSPRIVRLAEVPGLNEAPSSWCIIVTDRQARALVGTKGEELFLIDQGGQYQKQEPTMSEDLGIVNGMAVSCNNKYLALSLAGGVLWIGTSDLQKCYCEFKTNSSKAPQQLVWCGNGAVVTLWDKLILLVGPGKDWIRYTMDCSTYLLQEIDGLRIITNETHEFIQKVPEVTEKVFKIGSIEPGAVLFEASKEFQKRNQKADDYIRMIKDTLDVAVSQCVQASGLELEPTSQKNLLRAATFGKCFLTDYQPEPFVNMCQMLRVLNQVRHHSVGIPLTYTQLEHLSVPVLIDRLVIRKLFGLAVRVCQYLKIPDAEGRSRILAHWACFKVQQKHEEEEKLARAISQKLLDVPGVSFSEIAREALEHGRKQLAVKLLDYEPRASEQVPLLLKMGQDQAALTKAIDSGDTDLVYTVLLHLKDKQSSSGDFFMMIRTMPIACSLYIQYCRQQNIKLVEDLHYQEDNSLEEGNCKIIRSYTLDHLEDRAKVLEEANHCFIRCKQEFAAKQTEEQIKLLRHQRRLEDVTGRSFADLSLQKTIYQLILDNQSPEAEKLRKEFKVPDKRYWIIRINALAEAGDWMELERFSRSKKPPVGLEMFVEACMKYNRKPEAHKYLGRVAPEQKVRCLVKVGQLKEAAEVALETRNEDEFDYVVSRLGQADREVADAVRAMRSQLSPRK